MYTVYHNSCWHLTLTNEVYLLSWKTTGCVWSYAVSIIPIVVIYRAPCIQDVTILRERKILRGVAAYGSCEAERSVGSWIIGILLSRKVCDVLIGIHKWSHSRICIPVLEVSHSICITTKNKEDLYITYVQHKNQHFILVLPLKESWSDTVTAI